MDKIVKKIAVLGFLLLLMIACNIPTIGQSTSSFPEPDLTMTALFAQATLLTPAFQPQGTDTPGLQVESSNTPEATMTFTNTTAPTTTPSITPSATFTNTTAALPSRAGGYFVAQYLSSPPVIDGIWDEWSTTVYPAGSVVFGAANWTGVDDLDASFRVGWDYNNLYISAKVKDDVYTQNAVGQDIYMGDSLELLLDRDLYGDFYSSELNTDDYQLGISPGKPDTGGTKEAVLWFPRAGNGSRPQVVIGAVGGSGLYRVEAAIPWSVLGINAPSAGTHFGFVFSVSDDDDTSTKAQQSMVSAVLSRRLLNPTTWGELVLGN